MKHYYLIKSPAWSLWWIPETPRPNAACPADGPMPVQSIPAPAADIPMPAFSDEAERPRHERHERQAKEEKKQHWVGITLLLLVVAELVMCGFLIFRMYQDYAQEHIRYSQIRSQYSQSTGESAAGASAAPATAAPTGNPQTETVTNKNIAALQAQYPEAIGWLNIDGTGINYPFLQAEDNDKYLHAAPDGSYLYAGSLFVDSRMPADFSRFSTVIYGHHMKDGSMFGGIDQFEDKNYLNEHGTGQIQTVNKTYQLTIFACFTAKDDDGTVYILEDDTEESRAALLEKIQKDPRSYREIDVTAEDHIVLLSTCAYDYEGERVLLAAKLTDITND